MLLFILAIPLTCLYSGPKLLSPLPGLWPPYGSTGLPACAGRDLGHYLWRGCIFARTSNLSSFYALSSQGGRGLGSGGINCAPQSAFRKKDFPNETFSRIPEQKYSHPLSRPVRFPPRQSAILRHGCACGSLPAVQGCLCPGTSVAQLRYNCGCTAPERGTKRNLIDMLRINPEIKPPISLNLAQRGVSQGC
jgi:hypothetical protein